MLNKHRTIRTPSAARRIVVGLLVVAMTALALCVVTLSTAPPAAAASASWPTSWTTYTLANGNPVRDHTGDIPQEPDLGSGPCAGGGGGGGDCLGTSDTVYYASDGTNAFFRFRMSGDNNEASKGGYFGSAFIVRMYDAANTLKAVVGVNGKTSTADYVYVVNTDGNETVTPVNSTVYTYPWTGSNAGSRWISDGAGQYFLDIQVPITAIQNVWAQYTAGTPVKLYYGSSQAANLATINKDFMIAGDSTEAAMLASLASIAVVKVDNPVVTFDSQGGSAVATQTLTGATTTATQPTAPTRSGYAFNGWSDAASGGSAWSFGTAITADQTLYAQWTAAHTVTFDTHGGSAVADQAVTSGGTATQPAAPTRSGFSFNGWFTAASGGTAWNFASSTVTGATTIHAQWTADVVAQAITFAQPAAQEVGGTLTVAPTATSGLTVALTSSTTSVCTVSGFVITTLTTGTCTINANQAGNGSWSAAPQVSRSFALTTKAQTITFAQPGAKEVGDTFTPTPSASSGLTVSLTSTTTSVCTVSSGVVTTIATGTCTLAADQAGNGTWSAAPQVTQSLAVAKKSQTITFNPIADKEVGNTVTPTPSASSGLTVALTSTTPLVCTVASGTVTVVGAGTCTVAANQTGNGTWAAAFEVTQSFTATRVAQTITFNQPADTVIDGTFTPSPTASSNLAVALTSTTPSTCTVSSGAVTAVAAGTCTLAADQTGNGTYAAATTVTRSLIVAKKSQAITFDPIAGSTVGDTRSVAPTSSSGLTVAVTSATPSVCTVSGGTVTTTGTGTCTIHADQTGDATYAAASRVTRSFTVVAVAPVGLTAQTITFAQPSAGTIDDTFTPAPTSDSGLTVTVSSATPGVCAVSGGTVTLLTAGTCTLSADQAGNGTYSAATQVTRSLTVAKKAQTITFDTIADAELGDTRTVAPTASSSLPVAVSSTTPSVCTVSGGTVTAVAAGSCTLDAGQAGNTTWAAATTVTQSFTIGRKTQAITFAAIADRYVGDTLAPTPTATSGLAVALGSTTPLVCTVAGGSVTAVAAGTCTLTADQAGDATWDPASQVSRSFVVTRVAQTITVTQPAGLQAASVFNLGPLASSGLPVTLVSATPAVCTVAGGIVTVLEPGTCSLVASQAGNGTYLAAPDVPVAFPVTAIPLKAQVITFTTPSVLLSGAGAVSLDASATSSLPVSLALVSGDCGLTGDSLSAPEDTTCVVSASQEGDRSWSPADSVTRTIRFVSPADDTVSMASPLTGAKSMDVRMLANDPVELAMKGAGSPNNGSLVAGGETWMIYTPQEKFHGVDEFSYTVSDVLGRTAQAMVRVDVANADPVASGGTIGQLAGTTATAMIEASDPNDDAVTLSTKSAPHVGSSIVGRKVRVSPDETVSGWTVVKVRAADGFGGSAVAEVRSLVTPLPVARAERRLVDGGTVVSWREAATTDARYKILVDGNVACVTVVTSCTIGRFLGPDFTVKVQVLGLDGTSSTLVRAEAKGHKQVLLRTVYFEPGIATLGRAQTKRLTSVAALIRRIGFHDAHVSGYTDSDGGAAYNLALSKHRTQMVATYLQRTRQIDSAQAWFGYDHPVAPNDSDAGKSLNRRVEILVSY